MNEWTHNSPLPTAHLHTMQQQSLEESWLGKKYKQKTNKQKTQPALNHLESF